jgi:hypothetical protein
MSENELPWKDKVPIFSFNPDAATLDDVARMATQLMELCQERAARAKAATGEILSVAKFEAMVNVNDHLGAIDRKWICDAYRATHARAHDRATALPDDPPQEQIDAAAGEIDPQALAELRAELERLKARAAGPTIKAWLTREGKISPNKGQYNIWIEVENALLPRLKLQKIGGMERCWRGTGRFYRVDESAVPESLRLPLGGGPLAVELLIRPGEEE